jgi:predicted metal-dependent hydrolase
MNPETVRVLILSKLDWIQAQRQKLLRQDRPAPPRYLDGESHFFQGRRYLLRIVEHPAPPRVNLAPDALELYVRPSTPPEKRRQLLEEWLRGRLKTAIASLVAQYEPMMGVKVKEFGVKRMKTRWGTCNPGACRIWLNLELAQHPLPRLEYVVVHEMAHLLEPSHNQRFWGLMDQFYPQWRACREELNRLPLIN